MTEILTTVSAAAVAAAGLVCSARLRGRQLSWLPEAVSRLIGRKKGGAGRSQREAAAAALAATVGTGNVAGVAGAIALGGPGTVFWMWLGALLGMATKYTEIVLALKVRRPEKPGGPGEYLLAVPRAGAALSALFSAGMAAAGLGMGAMVQSSALTGAAEAALPPDGAARFLPAAAAALLAVCSAGGGAKRVGRLCAVLMPVMAGTYVLGCLAVLAVFRRAIPAALGAILRGALRPRSAASGLLALRLGIERGVFSNEAGLGSAAVAHGAGDPADPHGAGLLGIFEVFADTLVICSLTALCVLVTGTETAGEAWGAVFGRWGTVLVGAASVLFAFSSMIPWCWYGETGAAAILGERARGPYRAAFFLLAAAAPAFGAEGLWRASAVLNAAMALPNLAGILYLGKKLPPPGGRRETG